MTNLRTAAQQALETLEQLQGGCTDSDDGTVEAITVWCPEVIDALRAALAQQAEPVEPVAWCSSVEFSDALKYAQSFNGWRRKYPKTDMPLYTSPPQRKPLTDEEIQELSHQHKFDSRMEKFVRIIEQAHGIGADDAQV